MSEHYHIKWLPSGKLDWKPFPTPRDAKSFAKDLVMRGEKYKIERITVECAICARVKSSAVGVGARKPRNDAVNS